MEINLSMQRKSLCIFLVLLFAVESIRAQRVAIVPQPVLAEKQEGLFTLPQELIIETAAKGEAVTTYFRQAYHDRFQRFAFKNANKTAHLVFRERQANGQVDQEYYELEINPENIIISAQHPVGFFRGATSLLQLLEHELRQGKTQIACLRIQDSPRYSWRGFMLDESRHFFGKEKVKQLLDWMAFYKLNVFHWHLTDEPAWRIAIQRYPLLTFVGGIGSYKNPLLPAQYYSQEDMKEIVAYAAARFIDVVPEIDMPGHATAANRAYPSLSGGGTKEHPDFTFNPAKKHTYSFLTNVLKETNLLFPAGLLHLGGDEVAFGSEAWNSNPQIDSLKKVNKFTTNKEVENYFMQRMADSVFAMGAKILLWDEMADAGLPKDKSIMFWWRHDKVERLDLSLKNGYSTVICPRLPLYFDFVQDDKDRYGRRWAGAYNTLESVYSYDLSALEKRSTNRDLILGIQANLWTEQIADNTKFDYMVFPRIAALAELAWSADDRKSFASFQQVLKAHILLYQSHGIYYYDPFDHENKEPKTSTPTKKYMDNPE